MALCQPHVVDFFTAGWTQLQNMSMSNSNFYITNSFKYSPPRQTFSLLKPACFAHPAKPQIKKTWGYKTMLLVPFRALPPRDYPLGCWEKSSEHKSPLPLPSRWCLPPSGSGLLLLPLESLSCEISATVQTCRSSTHIPKLVFMLLHLVVTSFSLFNPGLQQSHYTEA